MPARKIIAESVKLVVRNVYKNFQRELARGRPLFSYERLRERVAVAVGLSKSTVRRVLGEDKSVEEICHSLHVLNKPKIQNKFTKMDGFNKTLLRNIVHQMYAKGEFGDQYSSLRRLRIQMDDAGVVVSRNTIRRSLVKMGFRFYKKHGKRFLQETQDVVGSRHSYLRKIKKYREGYEIVYVDETWINATHNAPGEWTENKKGVIKPECKDCGRFIPSGKGKRLIVLDAGSSHTGFIPDVGLIFTSKTNSADYHDEMNSKHFLEWFDETLIPALPNPTVIVLDNAPYHNVKNDGSYYPRTSEKKSVIQDWLKTQNIEFNNDEIKAELPTKVKAHKPRQFFQTDKIGLENGHFVLRLPVRHCELNPIELLQAQEKNEVGRENTTFKLKDVERLYKEVKGRITKEHWQKAEIHVAPVVVVIDEHDDDEQDDGDMEEGMVESDDEEEREDVFARDLKDSERVEHMVEQEGESDVVCKICGQVEAPNEVSKWSNVNSRFAL